MEELQLRRARWELGEAEGSAEEAGALVEHPVRLRRAPGYAPVR
jgi:hypothetical protein